MLFPGKGRSHQRFVLLLALASVGGLLALLALWIAPGPNTIEASQGSAQILFQTDRRFVNQPGDCFALSWEATGIQAAYLNGIGQTGQGTSSVCPQSNTMQRLEVVFEDGSRQAYFLQTGILPWQAEFWLLLGVALVGLSIVGRSIFGPLRRRPRLSAWIILLGTTATLALTLIVAVTHPRPIATGLTAGAARISLTADQDWVLRPTDCVTLTWALENIQAVHLNGEGIPGTGTELYCLTEGQPDFLVLLPDNSEVHTGPTIHVLLGLWGVIVLGGGAILLGGLAAWLGFAWARQAFQSLLQPLRTPEGRRQLLQIGLVIWIVATLYVYWVLSDAPGLIDFENLYRSLYRMLSPIFYAPYQG